MKDQKFSVPLNALSAAYEIFSQSVIETMRESQHITDRGEHVSFQLFETENGKRFCAELTFYLFELTIPLRRDAAIEGDGLIILRFESVRQAVSAINTYDSFGLSLLLENQFRTIIDADQCDEKILIRLKPREASLQGAFAIAAKASSDPAEKALFLGDTGGD